MRRLWLVLAPLVLALPVATARPTAADHAPQTFTGTLTTTSTIYHQLSPHLPGVIEVALSCTGAESVEVSVWASPNQVRRRTRMACDGWGGRAFAVEAPSATSWWLSVTNDLGGTRVPYTAAVSYSPPCSGVAVPVGANLQSTFNAHPEGTTFCLAPGVHRITSPITPRTNQKVIGRPGAVVSGAKAITNWVADGTGRWKATGQTQESEAAGTCVAGNTYSGGLCHRNEWVYYDDFFMRRVGSVSAVSAGTFYFDYATDTIYVGSDPTGHHVEGSVAPQLVDGQNTASTGVTFKGITFEKAANRYRLAAVRAGSSWTFDRVTVRLNHATGFEASTGRTFATFRHGAVLDNGAMGLGGYQASDFLVDTAEIARNQVLGMANDGDGTKFLGTTRLTVRGSNVHHNRGNGIWLDFANSGFVIEDNIASDNEWHGVQDEVNCGGVFRSNTVERNARSGFEVVASTNTDVDGNRVVGNGAGALRAWHQGRTSACSPGLSGVQFRNNTVGQTAGTNGVFVCCGATGNGSGRATWTTNRHYVANTGGAYWQFGGVNLPFPQWRARGFDAGSTLAPLSQLPAR